MRGLVAAVVGLPMVSGVVAGLAARSSRPAAAHRVTLVAAGLTAACSLALLCYGEDGTYFAVEWLPGTGAMGLATGRLALYAVVATTLGGFFALLGATSPGAGIRPLSGPMALLAMAAVNVAFLANHFLARYTGLEIVALCVALAPLIEVRGLERARMAWRSYLLLRVGDAGLLMAILILGAASSTLAIGPALGYALDFIEGTGSFPNAALLTCATAGFVLAAWVKMGGWPFHLWSQSGWRLSLASHAWLYATVVPNLGAYLLFRVTPLVALAGPLQRTALWMGAGGAALAALLALTQANPRAALVYVGAAQGGLAMFVAATGVGLAVLAGLLVLTPVRLLLFLAADAAQNASDTLGRRVSAGLFGLGAAALTIFSLLITWWAREASVPLDALFVAQVAAALTAVWAARTAWRLSSPQPGMSAGAGVRWTQWVAVGLAGGVVLIGGLGFEPLVRSLAPAGRMTVVTLPSFPALLRYAVTAPAMLTVAVLSLAAWRLQRRSGQRRSVATRPAADAYDLEEGLVRAAQALHAVVEVGIAERIVALIVRAVVNGARAAWTVEYRGLDGLTNRTARAVVDGASVAHRVVEEGGLEELLRRGGRAVMISSRVLQRWHTGKLRRNLAWLPVALALAVLASALLGG